MNYLVGQDLDGVLPPSLSKPLYINTVILHRIYLKGIIPHEWAALKLETLSLENNQFSGTIPPEFGRLVNLEYLTLNANYLTGKFPSSLANLRISSNNFTGKIPNIFRSWKQLEKLEIQVSGFEGPIPSSLALLHNLVELRISDLPGEGSKFPNLKNMKNMYRLMFRSCNVSGTIPDYIWEFPQMQILAKPDLSYKFVRKSVVVGYRLCILISFHVSLLLKNLHNIFPEAYLVKIILQFTENIPILLAATNCQELEVHHAHKLVLYSLHVYRLLKRFWFGPSKMHLRLTNPCGADGYPKRTILAYGHNAGMAWTRKVVIPCRLAEILASTNWKVPDKNSLAGHIPEWMSIRDSHYQIDLSYNNFSESHQSLSCRENLNLFQSFSGGKNLGPDNCLKNLPCSKDWCSVNINCGGGATTINGVDYEADEDLGGRAKYVPLKETWETSSTGLFWDTTPTSVDFIARNVSVFRTNNSKLYTRARLSPLSLTYYFRCLANENYTVTLHFAEIVIRDNRSYQSLRRRIFDVYVQEKLELKDFNIKNEEKGVDKAVIRKFKTVVRNKTLTIRFHWAGKGTAAIPRRGTYGPLISAMSVDSDHKPRVLNAWEKNLKFLVGAVVSVLCLILVILGILWWNGYFRPKPSREQVLRGLDLQTGFFTFIQMRAATNNFDAANKIGEGGFGAGYKDYNTRILLDCMDVALRELSCHWSSRKPADIGWPTRQKICLDIAKGLAFLHEESSLTIAHRDIKTTNVLLDSNLNAKISDFGLAKFDEGENTHISTRIAGTT
ncbi:probable leucine-rich repeat receptor-like serine/threonine-protein kinase At3g14840 [Gossypium arboreum]|uniref:probable leucine-rich repeat receptor-like serine/threonine-protein kinase At3g14840 n=1 Tax=Gossypium arboreum TaxID=29729 RepID=UPI0022F19AAD|nr:probable leucine-rich repeat receptor-like serine/threonine-protein kinase At3g14840 [Gossypium arboreum]